MDIIKELEALKIPHYSCEDSWYSCPLSEEGCSNDNWDSGECNCSANDHNKRVDNLIEYLSEYGF